MSQMYKIQNQNQRLLVQVESIERQRRTHFSDNQTEEELAQRAQTFDDTKSRIQSKVDSATKTCEAQAEREKFLVRYLTGRRHTLLNSKILRLLQ